MNALSKLKIIFIFGSIFICNTLFSQTEIELQKKASEFLKIGNYNSAIQKYSEAIAVNPNSYSNYANRGICKYKIKEYESAINDFNEAEIIMSARQIENCFIYYYRGSSYFELREYENALQDLLKCSDCYQVDFDPLRIESQKKLGLIYQELNDIETSLSIFKNLLKECSSCEDSLMGEIYLNLHNCYILTMDLSNTDNSNIINANYSIAWSKLYGNKEAIPSIKLIYEKYDAEDPNMNEQMRLGKDKESSGQYRQAIDLYNIAISSSPYYLESYVNRGKCYYAIQDYANALNDLLYYCLILNSPGGIDDIEDKILNSAFNIKELNIGLKFVNYMLELFKDHKVMAHHYTRKRADFYFSFKKYDLAILDYKKLLSMDDNDPGKAAWNLYIGICYANLNKNDVACKYLKKAKEYGSKSAADYIKKICK